MFFIVAAKPQKGELMKGPPLVIVIEDDSEHQNLIRRGIGGLYSLVFAEDIPESIELFNATLIDKSKHDDVLAIIFDGGLYSHGAFNTGGLVQTVVEIHGFSAATIAYSASHNDKLLAAGCRYSVSKGKIRILTCLLEFLTATKQQEGLAV